MIDSLKQNFYQPISKIFIFVFGKKKLKLFSERLFWFWVYLKESRLSNHHFEAFFTEHFDIKPEFYSRKKILDIGCGPRGSLEWATHASQRVGIDPLADFYRKLNPKLKMQLVQATAESMPFDDNYFDVVSSFNSLDHVDHLPSVIREIKRILKPNGVFLLISDIHREPTICEPSGFDWDIVERFAPELVCIDQQHYEGEQLYKSIRKGIAFDHSNPKPRFGILKAKFKKT